MGLRYLDDHPNRVTNGKHLDLIHWSFDFKALAKKSMPKFDPDSRNGLRVLSECCKIPQPAWISPIPLCTLPMHNSAAQLGTHWILLALL